MMINIGSKLKKGITISNRYYCSGNTSNGSISFQKQWYNIDKLSTYQQLRDQISTLIHTQYPQSVNQYQPLFSSINIDKIDADYSISNIFHLTRAINGEHKAVLNTLTEQINQKLASGTGLSSKLSKNADKLIQSVNVDKNHLNITVSQNYLEYCLKLWSGLKFNQIQQQITDKDKESERQRVKDVLVDFASPNMSKELHVGHLRSIALGESVCRILEYRLHNVERISHVGDFGTPMGMVITYGLENKVPFFRHIWDKDNKEATKYIATPKELSEVYAAAKQKSKFDKDFEVRSKLAAAELQKGPPNQQQQLNNNNNIGDGNEIGSDPVIYEAWQYICEASREGFNKIYKLMNVNVKERGESYYRVMLEGVIKELTAKGMLVVLDGAQCVPMGEGEKEVVVKKSDGAFLYATTDLAAIKSRIESGKQWIVVITDDSQKVHFEQVFDIAKRAGWMKEEDKVRVDHLSFGVVRGEDGKKLSSRDGNPIALIDLVDESINRAKQAALTSRSLTRAEKVDQQHTANRVEQPERIGDRFEVSDDHDLDSFEHYRKIGIGAMKYYDLVQRSNPYNFSYDQILSFKGNTSIYLNYCMTRILNILKRVPDDRNPMNDTAIDQFKFKEFTKNERRVIVNISKFQDTIKTAENQLKPAVICDYLWDVADSFHRFYESEPVIGSDREKQRLIICMATLNILKTGFYLLGVEPVNKL